MAKQVDLIETRRIRLSVDDDFDPTDSDAVGWLHRGVPQHRAWDESNLTVREVGEESAPSPREGAEVTAPEPESSPVPDEGSGSDEGEHDAEGGEVSEQ